MKYAQRCIRVVVQISSVLQADSHYHYQRMLLEALRQAGIPIAGNSLNFEPANGTLRISVNDRKMCIYEWTEDEEEL